MKIGPIGLLARFIVVLPLDILILALRAVWISVFAVSVIFIQLRAWIINDIQVEGVEHE